MNLNRLTAAPWTASKGHSEHKNENWCVLSPFNYPDHAITGWGSVTQSQADAEFIALARNAFDGDPEALAWWEANRVKREVE